jgi:hypothetical protein
LGEPIEKEASEEVLPPHEAVQGTAQVSPVVEQNPKRRHQNDQALPCPETPEVPKGRASVLKAGGGRPHWETVLRRQQESATASAGYCPAGAEPASSDEDWEPVTPEVVVSRRREEKFEETTWLDWVEQSSAQDLMHLKAEQLSALMDEVSRVMVLMERFLVLSRGVHQSKEVLLALEKAERELDEGRQKCYTLSFLPSTE